LPCLVDVALGKRELELGLENAIAVDSLRIRVGVCGITSVLEGTLAPRALPTQPGTPRGQGKYSRHAFTQPYFISNVSNATSMASVACALLRELRDGPWYFFFGQQLVQVVAHRLFAPVVQQPTEHRLAIHLAVDDDFRQLKNSLVEEKSRVIFRVPGFCRPGRNCRGDVVAVLELDHFVLVLQAFDRVNAAMATAVDLEGEPGERGWKSPWVLVVPFRLSRVHFHCHLLLQVVRPPQGLCALLSGLIRRGFPLRHLWGDTIRGCAAAIMSP